MAGEWRARTLNLLKKAKLIRSDNPTVSEILFAMDRMATSEEANLVEPKSEVAKLKSALQANSNDELMKIHARFLQSAKSRDLWHKHSEIQELLGQMFSDIPREQRILSFIAVLEDEMQSRKFSFIHIDVVDLMNELSQDGKS